MTTVSFENYVQSLAPAAATTGTELVPVVQAGTPVQMPVSKIGGTPRTAAEIAAGVTPTNYAYAPGDARRYGGAAGASTAVNDAAFASAALIGGDIVVPGGTWDYTTFWVKQGNVRIRGNGIGVTVLRPSGWVDGIRIADATYPSAATILNDVTVQDLTIDGTNQLAGANDTFGNGINLNACDRIDVHGCELRNVKNQHIVSTYYIIGGVLQKSLKIYDNISDGVLASQIAIGVEGAGRASVISGNSITNCSGDGIRTDYFSGSGTLNGWHVISGNNIQGNPGGSARGVNVGDNVYSVNVTDNLIQGFDFSIRCASIAASTFDYLIANNRCIGWTSGAISTFPMNGTDSSAALIIGNKIKSAFASGSSVGITASKGSNIFGNDIADALTGIAVVTGATNVRIGPQANNSCAAHFSDLGTGTIIENEQITYTPTWTSSGVAPVLGNGTLIGRFIRNGNNVTVDIQLIMGSTTTFGTGVYFFSLPTTIAGGVNFICGSAVVEHTGVSDYACIARADNTNGVRLFTGAQPAALVTNAVPFTFVSTDIISITLTYPSL